MGEVEDKDYDDDLLDEVATCRLIGGTKPIHPSTLWRGVKNGLYPRPIPVGPNMRRWRKSKLVAVIAAAEREAEEEAAA